MTAAQLPTTVAICCRLPKSVDEQLLADWMKSVRSWGMGVTWVAGPDEIARVAGPLEGVGEGNRLAVEVPDEWNDASGSPSLLRRRLEAVRRAAPSLDSLVLRGGRAAASPRPDRLVEQGIRIVARGRLSRNGARTSRRPAPSGWSGHCPVWGLWEVAFAPKPSRSGLGKILSFSLAPTIPSGSLSVLRAGWAAGRSKRESRQDLERMLHWVSRRMASRPRDTLAVSLSELASMLTHGPSETGQRSVLAA